MKDQIISLETAELSYEKGFKWKSIGHTQSVLQKWLRDVHKIDVFVIPNFSPIYTTPFQERGVSGYDIHERTYDVYEVCIFIERKRVYCSGHKDTYEEALEEGLQEALKLLKESKP